MPVYIGDVTSEVGVVDGEMPLSPAQIDKLVAIVMKRLHDKHRDSHQSREATRLRREARPPGPIAD
jgi:hypothetical protein